MSVLGYKSMMFSCPLLLYLSVVCLASGRDLKQEGASLSVALPKLSTLLARVVGEDEKNDEKRDRPDDNRDEVQDEREDVH